MRSRQSVRGKVALVTGAGRGIGRAIAHTLWRAGAKVAVTDLDLSLAESVARELGADALAHRLDVTHLPAFEKAVERVERELGPVEVLVGNAGIMSIGPFLEQPLSRDRAQIAVNLDGVSNGMRAVLPGMLARRSGHVVNVASVAGRVGSPFAASYAASKFAVIGLTESVRAELDGQGVDFSYVMPALVDTDMISGAGRPAWPKVATPDDVARAVLDAIETKKVDVYVPKVARISVILPALLPRSVLDQIGRALHVDKMFAKIDLAARRRYDARIDPSAPPDPPPGPFGPTPRASA